MLYVHVVGLVWSVPDSSPKWLRGVSGRAGGLVWRRRDLGPQSPAHRGSVVAVAASEEASAGGGLLGGPPLISASQAESGDVRAAPIFMDGPVRAGRRRSATASPTFACSQQVPPAGAGGERCLPRCPRGPRQMGWPGQMGTDEARVTWAAGGVQLPEGPRFLLSGNPYPTCSLLSL